MFPSHGQMIHKGSDCNFRIFCLTDENNCVELITSRQHNHESVPGKWRLQPETRVAIKDIIINDASITASSNKIKSLQTNFHNTERTKKVVSDTKKKLFGTNQNLWHLIPYEQAIFDKLKDEDYKEFLDYNIKNWLKAFIVSSSSFTNIKGECEMFVTIMPPLGVEILSHCKSFCMHVKHKLNN
jgi:hypothetical protein